MTADNDTIFGSGILHERFCATTDLLAKLVASAPRALTLAQLQSATGREARVLARLCVDLQQDGLITASAGGGWSLARDPSEVTLEDVYRCVVSNPAARTRPLARAVAHHANHAVDLLLMQATLAINQSVHQHLRQFSLDRLKPAVSVRFPAGRHALRGLNYDGFSDLNFAA
ncbi:MAG: Rrf2 family transcriptional regulator [Pseudomonadota bacterium]|nr:Rrf2 family transcriptional regulator [Pseudomonadota bacterium]